MLLPFALALWIVCLADPVYLTMEEVGAIPRSRDPAPFNGHPLLADLRNECRYPSNDKHTYFICPFKWIYRVSNQNRNQRVVMGLYSEITGDPYGNKLSESLYTDGFDCAENGKSSAKLVIRCNRDAETAFEIVSIQELSPCFVTIVADSPMVCMVSRGPKRESDEKEALLRQARDLLKGIVHHAETIDNLLGQLLLVCCVHFRFLFSMSSSHRRSFPYDYCQHTRSFAFVQNS